MKLSLKNLLAGTVVRMRFTRRWSTSRVLFPENVAEHSYFVSLYCLFLVRWCRAQPGGLKPDMGTVLERALLHDIEEARSGDIHRPFKHSTSALREALDTAAQTAAMQVLEEVTPTDYRHYYERVWRCSKDLTVEGKLVNFADYLAVLAFILQEGPGAVESLDLRTLEGHASHFGRSEYDFIRPLVDEANGIVWEILHGQK